MAATTFVAHAHPHRAPARATGTAHDLYATITVGSRVTLRTPQGQERTGRAVMLGPAGWVLNIGGRHGTPGVVSATNLVAVWGRRVDR